MDLEDQVESTEFIFEITFRDVQPFQLIHDILLELYSSFFTSKATTIL